MPSAMPQMMISLSGMLSCGRIYLGSVITPLDGRAVRPRACHLHEIHSAAAQHPGQRDHHLRHGAGHIDPDAPVNALTTERAPISDFMTFEGCEAMALSLPRDHRRRGRSARRLQSFPRWIDTGTKVAMIDRCPIWGCRSSRYQASRIEGRPASARRGGSF